MVALESSCLDALTSTAFGRLLEAGEIAPIEVRMVALESSCLDALTSTAFGRLLEAEPSVVLGGSLYWGLTPCPSGLGIILPVYVFSGYHGYSAGRGVDPAGGAP
ncbi:hypothetical protein F511_11268 [Dorcoceras hygrometricum]|uniref:Uncharacterized protein n=1 Tax=Dorcoceras hygrometricum TaxID=472368 RepID=A0A2Z7CC46_9LAMI|nr:hypothetical protein F511_11268 [Dorcoceras hygrometricum]